MVVDKSVVRLGSGWLKALFLIFTTAATTSPTTIEALSSSSPSSRSSSSQSSPTPSLYGSTTRNIATQVLQGTGPPQVDLDQYNLPYDQIVQELTVQKVQKVTESSGRFQLTAKSTKEHYIDTILVSFPRSKQNKNGGSLGIELLELAGGRDDGIGITIVSGIVEGGNADGSQLLPGDSIESISLVRRRNLNDNSINELQQVDNNDNDNDGDDNNKDSASPNLTVGTVDDSNVDENLDQRRLLAETEEVFSVSTLCLDYDKTVEMISSIPPMVTSDDDDNDNDSGKFEDTYTLKIKRIRRRPKVRVRLQYPPDQMNEQQQQTETIEMYAGENLRQGMLIRGVKLNDPLAQRFDTKQGGNCGAGGLCRTCSVVVQDGTELLNPQRPAERQMLADQPRWRLACKAIVGFGMQEGELSIRVNPRQWS